MTRRVLVYRLYEPGELDDSTVTLGTLLAVPGPGRPLRPSFAALPGGCFRWFDEGRIHRNPAADRLPPNAADARKAALAYMRAVNGVASRYRQERSFDRRRFPDPFPLQTLRPGAAYRVPAYRDGRRLGDAHWFTSWGLSLAVDPDVGGAEAAALGAVIEIRVGPEGQVVGVVSRVRPWHSIVQRPAFSWTETHDHGHDHGGGHGEAPPLVYVSDCPDERLRFLSPCWLIEPEDGVAHDHTTRSLWPACDHTLLPEIAVEPRQDGVSVTARLLGAGRSTITPEHGSTWRLRWSVADLRAFIDGESRTTEGSSARLPGPGLFQVALEVEHLATGAIRSTHAQVPIHQTG